ncbi:putative tape measure protein [Alteromonas phage P24]|nr:putative tape measure protein [Alteromonas phage P24]
MSKYEFIISAQDKTAQAFTAINSKLGTVTKQAVTTAAAVAGVTASFAVMASSAVNSAKELDAQAKLAGVTVEEFQALSYAYGQFNISQEKFADISKDVQDKLGDFLATGAGPFKDFFEQVAPKVGLTADALKNLSSSEVLIAVKKAMDDANVSAKEQVFYMESLANDATLLIPALEDNGKVVNDLAQEYRDLNLAISETDVTKVKDLSDEMARLEAAGQKLKFSLASAFVEPLADIGEAINDFYTGSIVRFERDFIEIDKFVTEAKLSFLQFKEAVGANVDTAEMDKLAQRAEYLSDQYDKLTRKIKGEPIDYEFGYGETGDIFKGLENPFDLSGAVTNIDTSPITKQVEEATKEVEHSFLNSLALIDDINANAFNFDESMAENAGMFWDNFEERGFTAYENLQEGNQSFWDNWLAAAQNNLTSFDELSAFTIESFSNQMGNALESVVFDSESLGDAFKGVMQGMARSVVNALGQMAAQWIAYKLVQLAIGKSTAVAGAAGLALNAQAQSLMAGLNAFASTAAIPVVGPPAAPAAMGAALAVTQPIAASISALTASAAIASYDGGGFTGAGARIGGMDGKGGKLAMLHPREKVIDLTRGQGEGISISAPITFNGANMSPEELLSRVDKLPKAFLRKVQSQLSRPR